MRNALRENFERKRRLYNQVYKITVRKDIIMKNIVTAVFLYDILTEDSAAGANGCAAWESLAGNKAGLRPE